MRGNYTGFESTQNRTIDNFENLVARKLAETYNLLSLT